jgi:mRNA interferase MazF
MHSIHLAQLDKLRPVVVLTRDAVRARLERVTVAPITSHIRGISTEVPVGPANGVEYDSVVTCDNIQTIWKSDVGRHMGSLFPEQEAQLTAAIVAAFALE